MCLCYVCWSAKNHHTVYKKYIYCVLLPSSLSHTLALANQCLGLLLVDDRSEPSLRVGQETLYCCAWLYLPYVHWEHMDNLLTRQDMVVKEILCPIQKWSSMKNIAAGSKDSNAGKANWIQCDLCQRKVTGVFPDKAPSFVLMCWNYYQSW